MRRFRALAFDVGGSVFDWKGSISQVLQRLAVAQGVEVDAQQFALEWRRQMFLVLVELRRGKLPDTTAEQILPLALQRVLPGYAQVNFDDIAIRRLLQAWHTMKARKDFPPALARLKEKYMVMVLSILNFSIITDSSKASGITWDGVISCEFLGHYKPEPSAYLEGCARMGFAPAEVCLVAVHPYDLVSAKAVGMGAAFVEPQFAEPDISLQGLAQLPQPEDYDFYARDFEELADMMCSGVENYRALIG